MMSSYDKYILENTGNPYEFEFTSTGPKGDIRKIIRFSPTHTKSIVNLAFGNICENRVIDVQQPMTTKTEIKYLLW